MPTYRLKFLNLKGAISREIDLECEDDAHAIAAVARHSHEYRLELWRGRRFVKGFPPRSTGEAADTGGRDPAD